MNIKTSLAAAAVGAVLAIPVTAGAVGAAGSADLETPCGVDAEWMQEHWNDPAHWDEMQGFMQEHWDDMQGFMQEHWDEMGPFMHERWDETRPDGSSDDFAPGPGMMGGFGTRGPAGGGFGGWQGDGS